MQRITNIVLFIIVLIFSSGCFSVSSINEKFRRIDRMWQLEYQKNEDAFRYRVIDFDYVTVFHHMRKTFIDLGLPVQSQSFDKGVVVAQVEAPTPLTKEEWKKIVEVENPRVKKESGGIIRMLDDPKDYIITWTAIMKPMYGKTFILLEYKLDNPKHRERGLVANQYGPPLAIQLMSSKFWTQLEKRLETENIPVPRRRTEKEKLLDI